jgi:large subunit ribosomal protein L32
MAVPKHKVSKSRKHMRSAHNFTATATTLTECPNCHAPVAPHTVCKACGNYKGTKRMETRKDRQAAKTKKENAAS